MMIMSGARHLAFLLCMFTAGPAVFGDDWPEWRGPRRDGSTREKGLPEKWSPKGENLLWRVPIGGRSAPVVYGDRVFLFTTAGRGEMLQEQITCLDAISGKILWQ